MVDARGTARWKNEGLYHGEYLMIVVKPQRQGAGSLDALIGHVLEILAWHAWHFLSGPRSRSPSRGTDEAQARFRVLL